MYSLWIKLCLEVQEAGERRWLQSLGKGEEELTPCSLSSSRPRLPFSWFHQDQSDSISGPCMTDCPHLSCCCHNESMALFLRVPLALQARLRAKERGESWRKGRRMQEDQKQGWASSQCGTQTPLREEPTWSIVNEDTPHTLPGLKQ